MEGILIKVQYWVNVVNVRAIEGTSYRGFTVLLSKCVCPQWLFSICFKP